MTKGRLEAFSDGVFAIIITIMVLELKAPHAGGWAVLHELALPFLAYVLSFIYVGIYWNNHHHLLHAARTVSGGVLWANLHLLFWLSLFPFVTDWVGESHFSREAMAAYGVVLFLATMAYLILQNRIICCEGQASFLGQAIGADLKGKLSSVLYLAGVAVACWHGWLAALLYAIVALMWLIPDRRIEQRLNSRAAE